MTQELCECGCGEIAPRYKWTNRKRGQVKGESARFVRGHNRKWGRQAFTNRCDENKYGWVPIPDHPKYFACREGFILGLTGRVMKPSTQSNAGYYTIKMCVGNRVVSRSVHRLVATTFIPNPENNRDVNHKSGVKTDNRVENLEWLTHSENAIHGFENGLLHRGEKHPNSKLTEEQVREMRCAHEAGEKYVELGERYGVSPLTVGQICRRKSWRWVA